MSRVVLVNPTPDYDKALFKKFDISMGVGIPMGVLLLGSCLEQEGFSAVLIDGQVVDPFEKLEEVLSQGDVLCVGLSVMTSQLLTACEMANLVKQKYPDVPVVFGGFHFTIFPDSLSKYENIDYVIKGEGDVAFIQLCQALDGRRSLSEVGNLVYREGGEIRSNEMVPLRPFEEMPPINYSLLGDIEAYVVKRTPAGEATRFINVLAGMGCNFECRFCHNAIQKKKHRVKAADRLYDEIVWLNEKFNITDFGLVDENFFGSRSRIKAFVELIEKGDASFTWSSTLRASFVNERYLSRSYLKRIFENGGVYFGVGAESGSDRVLKIIKKGSTVEDVQRVASMTKGLMRVAYSFIVGIPGESVEDTIKTYRFIEKIRSINRKSLIIGPQVFRPYPGSPLFDDAVAAGLKVPENWAEDHGFLRQLASFQKVTPSQMPWYPAPEWLADVVTCQYILKMNYGGIRFLRKIILFFVKRVCRLRLKHGWLAFSGLEKKVFARIATSLN